MIDPDDPTVWPLSAQVDDEQRQQEDALYPWLADDSMSDPLEFDS